MLSPYTESVLANHKIPAVQNGNAFAGNPSSSPLPTCEYSVSDFLHLGSPAPFAGEAPAVVDAAAPRWGLVALQVPLREAGAVVPPVALTASPGLAALLWGSFSQAWGTGTQRCLVSTCRPVSANHCFWLHRDKYHSSEIHIFFCVWKMIL